MGYPLIHEIEKQLHKLMTFQWLLTCSIRFVLDEEKNGYVARDQLLNALYYSYMLDSCQQYQLRQQREGT